MNLHISKASLAQLIEQLKYTVDDKGNFIRLDSHEIDGQTYVMVNGLDFIHQQITLKVIS